MNSIQLSHIDMAYKEKWVMKNFSLTIPAGITTCVMAPSGSGKTTLLRLLMGLERPLKGSITGMEGQKISAVFQEDRLCEQLDAVSNIRLPSPRLKEDFVREQMAAIGLAGCEGQPAAELSGGMRRRTALLRGLLADWDILFLDEPFGGLDQDTKSRTMAYTRTVCQNRTVVFVTHDAAEAEGIGAGWTIKPVFLSPA